MIGTIEVEDKERNDAVPRSGRVEGARARVGEGEKFNSAATCLRADRSNGYAGKINKSFNHGVTRSSHG